MAKNTRLASFTVNAQADLISKLLTNGYIDIFDGKQPEDCDDPVTNQVLGVTLRFGSPAFMPAIKGVITANPIQSGVAITELKKATWARCYREDHKTAILDVSVGERDASAKANILLPNTHIVRAITITCSSFIHSVAKRSAGV